MCLQVSTLQREVSDLGQVMKRMVQLMETLVPSVPQPAVICPTHYSPAHHAYLRCRTPPQSYSSPSPSKTASIWTDPPMPLLSSSLTISQQHGTICHADSLTHRPQSLQLQFPATPRATLTPDLSVLHPRPSSVVSEPPMPSSSFSSPDLSRDKDGAPSTITPRVHSPPPQDGGDDGPHRSSGCSSQTGLGGLYPNPTLGL